MKTKTNRKLRKILSIALCLALVMSYVPMVSITASAAATDITVTIDTGVSVTLRDADGDDYYDIGTADELYAFAAAANGGNNAINGELTADITLNAGIITANSTNARCWTPIGSNDNQYKGSFDGGNHTVSGIYAKVTGSGNVYVGLFGYVGKYGTIRNIDIVNSYFSGTGASTCVGGVVGYNYGSVSNCSNSGDVSGTGNSTVFVGGVVSYNFYGSVSNCSNSGDVSGTGTDTTVNVGGVVGFNYYSTVSNCSNSGDVSGTANSTVCIGGVVGSAGNGYSSNSVNNCYNTGDVSDIGTGTATTVNIGGVVGRNYISVINCYNTGSVIGGSHAGGVVGSNSGTVTKCYYLDKVDGTSNPGGIYNADETGKAEKKTTTQFASGEVAYLLQQGNTEQVWGQDNNQAGATPVFDATGLYKVVTVGETGNYSVANVGDTNGDGTVDVIDYQALVNKALADDHEQIETASYDDIVKYDLDGDGYLDVIDAYLLHLFINGFTTVDVYAVGDYDLNGVAFEESDIKAIKHAIENPTKLSTAEKYSCDINGDGKVSEADLTELTAIYGEVDSIEHTFLGHKCKICGLNELNIADISKTVYFNDNDNKLDLSTLFALPDGAGSVTYELVSGNGNLDGSTLNIVLQGAEKIKVTVAETETYSADEFEITVTVEAPKGSGSFDGEWVTIGF